MAYSLLVIFAHKVAISTRTRHMVGGAHKARPGLYSRPRFYLLYGSADPSASKQDRLLFESSFYSKQYGILMVTEGKVGHHVHLLGCTGNWYNPHDNLNLDITPLYVVIYFFR